MKTKLLQGLLRYECVMATRRDEWTVQLDQKGLDETLAATLMDGSVPQLGSRLMALALNSCPQSSSVIALTFRVDTPCTYISTRLAISAFSLRW